ncbi:hypothetical protein DIPPA_27331 [Diplonema papillatum]|nr:hypothetical protein DIPPA_27331 [Diplonema papillatum]
MHHEVVKTRASLRGIEEGIVGGAGTCWRRAPSPATNRTVIANAPASDESSNFCDAGVPEDEQHMWWNSVKWGDVRGEMKPCMALCGVLPKDAMVSTSTNAASCHRDAADVRRDPAREVAGRRDPRERLPAQGAQGVGVSATEN